MLTSKHVSSSWVDLRFLFPLKLGLPVVLDTYLSVVLIVPFSITLFICAAIEKSLIQAVFENRIVRLGVGCPIARIQKLCRNILAGERMIMNSKNGYKNTPRFNHLLKSKTNAKLFWGKAFIEVCTVYQDLRKTFKLKNT